jgi:hypothetical protein
VNLHDWIDELCDLLDLETEVDEGLLNDLAGLTHDNVDKQAGPVTTYLLGYAAATRSAGPAAVERLAGEVQSLAEGWDRPAEPDDADEDDGDDGDDRDEPDGPDLGLDDEDADADADDEEGAR